MELIRSVSGIRGVVGDGFTAQDAADFAAALGTYLAGGEVVIGRDSRPSGAELYQAASAALVNCGCTVIDLGITSTPGVAFMVRAHRAAGGLIITASHNPAPWNGLKFLSPEGSAPDLETARAIWSIRDQRRFRVAPPDRRGRVVGDPTADEQHVAAVLGVVDAPAIEQRRFRVVLDSNHGAGGAAGRLLLEALGCRVFPLFAEPHGNFAHPPEPLEPHLTELGAEVRRAGADIGFAQDPDADRLAIVDERGRYLGEEYTLALSACHLFRRHPGPAATTLSTSRMIDDLAEQAGGNCVVHRTAVGEANVVAGIREHDCVIGGEGNGGVIDPRVGLVRDSITAMALTLQLLADEGRSVGTLADRIPRYAIVKHKVTCPQQRIEEVLAATARHYHDQRLNVVDGVRVDWPDRWVHVRGSNTEPIVRIIAEAREPDTARALAADAGAVVDRVLAC